MSTSVKLAPAKGHLSPRAEKWGVGKLLPHSQMETPLWWRSGSDSACPALSTSRAILLTPPVLLQRSNLEISQIHIHQVNNSESWACLSWCWNLYFPRKNVWDNKVELDVEIYRAGTEFLLQFFTAISTAVPPHEHRTKNPSLLWTRPGSSTVLPVRTSGLLQRKQTKASEGKPLTKMFKTESEISK